MTTRSTTLTLAEAIEMASNGQRVQLSCPAHDDSTPSLSVVPGDTQPVVFTCFSGETQVMTRTGQAAIADLAARGSAELLVPSTDVNTSRWVESEVKEFGVQRLYAVTLRSRSATKVIHATADHRWFTRSRNEAPLQEQVTTELGRGDRLESINLPRRKIQTVSSFGVAHGIAFGDGTASEAGYGWVDLFGEKMTLIEYFPHSKSGTYRDNSVRVSGLPLFFKKVPDISESAAYLYGWLAGYFATDGGFQGKSARITSAKREHLQAVRDVASRLGIHTYPISKVSRIGINQTEESDYFAVTLALEDLGPEFFVRPDQFTDWLDRNGESGKARSNTWTVESVEKTDRVETVYCATVDDVHAFALEDNILTGNCHANCLPEDILSAAGLTWADVSNEETKRQAKNLWTPAGTATNLYPYHDAEGTLVYEVLRVYENGKKRFFQRQPDPDAPSGYKWNLDGVTRLLYRLPQVLEAAQGGATIWIGEGEKCVEALLKVIPPGDEATCNSGGAGKFLPQFAETLAGADVVICADSDDAGRDHARSVRELLMQQGCVVRILEAPPGILKDGKPIKDVADHLAAGRDLDSMLETTPGSHAERARSAVDWQDVLKRPEHEFEFIIPNTLARSERLLLVGLEGHGKSVALRQIATCVASGLDPFTLSAITPRRVLYIDAENHPGQVVAEWKRMNFLIERNGGNPQPGMLMILEEWDSTIDLISPKGRTWLKERVHAYRPDLICLGPLKNLVQRNLSDHESVHQLRTTINEARAISESAVVMEHHAPLRMSGDKERELRPYGSGLFLGWPDFGYAMKPTDQEGMYQWQQFRGDRVRGRQWPEALRWGKGIEMPWTSCLLDNEE